MQPRRARAPFYSQQRRDRDFFLPTPERCLYSENWETTNVVAGVDKINYISEHITVCRGGHIIYVHIQRTSILQQRHKKSFNNKKTPIFAYGLSALVRAAAAIQIDF
jgi:hypothetical protein